MQIPLQYGKGDLSTEIPASDVVVLRPRHEKGLPDDGAQGTQLDAISVAGEPGFWISGAPHGFFFVCYDVGECRQERYRLAGNVLLWELDGVTLRLESALTLEDALAIAESIPAPE